MSWTKQKKQDLADDAQAVIKATLRYLGRREYTAKELTQRLKARGAATDHISAALTYAQNCGFQNDARAGESHIRQRINYAPRGRLLVKQELQQRGINRELADTLLDEHYPRELERDLLCKILNKYTATDWQKAARHLASKGFDRELISEELEKTLLFW